LTQERKALGFARGQKSKNRHTKELKKGKEPGKNGKKKRTKEKTTSKGNYGPAGSFLKIWCHSRGP